MVRRRTSLERQLFHSPSRGVHQTKPLANSRREDCFYRMATSMLLLWSSGWDCGKTGCCELAVPVTRRKKRSKDWSKASENCVRSFPHSEGVTYLCSREL